MHSYDEMSLKLQMQHKEIESLRSDLYDLIAVLNRDGGHYRERHGIKAAIENGLQHHYSVLENYDRCRYRAGLIFAALFDGASYESFIIDNPEAAEWFKEE